MIISHSKKFVLSKPYKVAGTSVQIALAKHSKQGDVIGDIWASSIEIDSDQPEFPPKLISESDNHLPPQKIIEKYGCEDYYWITIVRNPYDQQISWMYQINSEGHDYKLEEIIEKYPQFNTKFYFKYDYVIRFEHLEEDYKKLCEILDIPYEPLPKTKDKIRKDKGFKHLYTPELEQIVYDKCKFIFDTFGYERLQFVSGEIPATT